MSEPNNIPQELQTTDPVLWWLLMYLSDTSLDVLLVSPFGICRTVSRQFKLNTSDYLSSLQEVVYQNEWLLSEFGRASAIVQTRRAMMAPSAFNEQTMSAMLGVLWPEEGLSVCSDRLGDGMGTLMCGIAPALMAYLQRTFPAMSIHHRLTPIVSYCSALSRDNQQVKLFANVTDTMVDIVYISDGKIQAINTFDISGPEDVLYYVMMVARTYNFDTETDAMMVFGSDDLRLQVAEKLSDFIGDIRQPSLYQLANSQKFNNVPVELTLMPLCV